MIKKVSDIMERHFREISALHGVHFLKDINQRYHIEYFPVTEGQKIIGIVTSKELIIAHNNRIAADAMNCNYLIIEDETPIWEAKRILEEEKIDLLIVANNSEILGIVSSTVLDIEFGKHIDLLTGLYKTEYIFYHAQELIQSENEISIIFFDINNFGIIDKKYGHIYGDNVLKEIACLLDRHKPDKTYLCRFGGDEFVLLTPFFLDSARQTAEELLNLIASNNFLNGVNISISAGIAGGRRINNRAADGCETVANLINIASLACSEAKNSTDKLSIVLGSEGIGIA